MAQKHTKRKDGRYSRQVVIGYLDGKPQRKTIYGKTLKELDKNYRDFMSLKERGIIIQDENLLVSDLADMWLKNEKEPNVRRQTYAALRSRVSTINKYIGNIKVQDLTMANIEQMRKAMVDLGHICQYNQMLADLKAILRYGVSKNVLSRNVAVDIKPVKYDPPKKRALTSAELDAFQRADLPADERIYIQLLRYTGIRRNEAFALATEDIDFKRNRIRINKTLAPVRGRMYVQELTKTPAGVRMVPILPDLRQDLWDYVHSRSDGPLFLNKNGNYYDPHSVHCFWKRILKQVQAVYPEQLADDITPHIFRHTFASDLYKAGMGVKEAQYILGHDDIKTTLNLYTHFEYADIQVDKLENYFYAVKMQSSPLPDIKKA